MDDSKADAKAGKGIGKGRNPNSLKNLKPFEKGCPPGPGRKPYRAVELEFQSFLQEMVPTKAGDKSRLELLMNGQFMAAAKGDSRAANLMMDRAFGKAKQEIAMTGADGGPLQIIVKGLED